MRIIRGFQGAAFGLVDGFICLSGIILAVAGATSNPTIVLIAGLAGGIADGLGNSIGFYISELTERGYQIHGQREHGERTAVHSRAEVLLSAVFAFISTFAVLVVLIIPFILLGIYEAMIASFAIAIVGLFSLGSYVGKLSGESQFGTGLKYAILGIVGAAVALFVGYSLRPLTIPLGF